MLTTFTRITAIPGQVVTPVKVDISRIESVVPLQGGSILYCDNGIYTVKETRQEVLVIIERVREKSSKPGRASDELPESGVGYNL